MSIRSLAKSPGYALAAISSLALGIAGNAAMFSLVYSVMLKPLSYHEPERLMVISEFLPKFSNLYPTVPVSAGHYARIRDEAKSFEAVAALDEGNGSMALTGSGEPERLGMVRMTHQLFDVLGVRPALGRTFTLEESREGAPNVVILSDSVWRRRFSADPAILGKRILLDGVPYEVIGVTKQRMLFPSGNQLHPLVNLPERPDIFLPLRLRQADLENPEDNFNYAVIARLRPGSTEAAARAEFAVLFASITKRSGKLEMYGHMRSLHSTLLGEAGPALWILMAAVGVVLLIVCVNVANLSLVRATVRSREMAIRSALGARPLQLVKQSLAESLLLSLAGGLAGVVVALWIVELLVARAPVYLPRLEETAVDRTVLLFCLGLCVATTLLFGLLPALRIASARAADVLAPGSRGNTDGPRGARLRATLVSFEVGLSAVLLICAGLLLTSFVKLMRVDRGFQSENVLGVDLDLPHQRYDANPKRRQFFQTLRESAAALPGVQQAGYISMLPLRDQREISVVFVEGMAKSATLAELPVATYRSVSNEYFPALSIGLRSGRLFRDDEKEMVALISEKFARQVFAGQDPIGKRFRRGTEDDNPWLRVIGTVGDVRSEGLQKEPPMMVYQPYWQNNASALTLVVRSEQRPESIASALRQAVWQLDPQIPVPPIVSMERVVGQTVSNRRFQAMLVAMFALVALVLACIGIYGVVSYAVAQRRAEMGVRMAMGASESDIRRLVLTQGLMPVWTGLLAGVTGALALSRLLAGALFGVSAVEPAVYASVVLTLLIIAALACYLPARRASRVSPMTALRYE
ncbi:MAG: ABC transporter permease [Bryobacterales bacterium]|nr:ABC transporter permease [Bryobacterales bacterium]